MAPRIYIISRHFYRVRSRPHNIIRKRPNSREEKLPFRDLKKRVGGYLLSAVGLKGETWGEGRGGGVSTHTAAFWISWRLSTKLLGHPDERNYGVPV